MTYQLIPLDKGNVPSIPVQRPVVLIGRHPECDVRIALSKISRRHCCVAMAYDRVLIRDLGSRNGVRVNGQVIEESQLVAGDEVAIGPLIYRLVADTPPPAAAPRRTSSSQKDAPPDRESLGPEAGFLSPLHDEETDLVPLDDLE